MDEKVTESSNSKISKPALRNKKNTNFSDFLIYYYLEGVNKVLAAKFMRKVKLTKLEHSPDFPTLREVVQQFYESNQRKNNFLDILIYDYLQRVNTVLAAKFMKKVGLSKPKHAEDFPTLQDVVVHFYKFNQQERGQIRGNVRRNVYKETLKRKRKEVTFTSNINELVHQRHQKKRRYQIQNRFSDHEVQVLREYIDKYGDKICYTKLAKELGRKHKAPIWKKVHELKKGTVQNRKRSTFTLEEDYCIIDYVLSAVKDNIKLIELDVNKNTCKLVAEQLQRNYRTVYKRWNFVLKHWMLSYYCGVLNLNINSMMINYLAPIYQYHDVINWDDVIKRPEFAGHTTGSLVACLSTMLTKAANFLGTNRSELTLKKVAELVNDESISVSTRNLKDKFNRQQKIITYFEQCVETHNIPISYA